MNAIAGLVVMSGLGVYASGTMDTFSPKDDNVAESAQNSMTMLNNQTEDLESSIVEVVKSPFGAASEYDQTLFEVSEFIQEIQTDVTVDQNQAILAVEELQLLWSPRYDAARREYLKLNHRLEYAKNNTARYFDTQFELTNQINNPELRKQRKEYYAQQKTSFLEWQTQASTMFENTKKVMDRLNDVNIVIEQQTLEAYFTGLIQEDGFSQVPQELLLLDKELDLFREKTSEINQLFQNDS